MRERADTARALAASARVAGTDAADAAVPVSAHLPRPGWVGSFALRPARAGWAGPGALRALAAGGEGTVALRLHDGAYLELPGGWLLLAPPRSPIGPLTLLVDGLPVDRIATGDRVVVVGSERIELDGVMVELGGVRPVESPRAPARAATGVHAALAAALAVRPRPSAELEEGLAALANGRRAEAVALLAGRGPGLTPAGDDVLAGYAAWCHAERAAATPAAGRDPDNPSASRAAAGPAALSLAAAPRTSPLSLAYLRCAERGELPVVAARVLAAVRRGDRAGAARAAGALDGWGASSGSALLWGIAAGVAETAA
ncbi:DUF2877 domain-containing protein [Conexibacter sp. CPCC 206217]|uniref:oxamate carbamoyltransferase subunit AllH family protein n=1 Tax=Conexibacter sp. CPCC 206217 TaxID=3064574 RepID=UPI00271DF65F|nr:DUF2877 domain-containing protein [Conexibacter sp. CPCC 206217]MDO8212353.1 DUF2877 domain-containing protein [Conexibacter sp. CPCC 206217]